MEPSDKNSELYLEVIGVVRNDIQPSSGQNWEEVVSEIVVREDLSEALDKLEEFSHIVVLFWVPRVADLHYKIHPRRDPELPLVGLFATRSQNRPNPVGVSTVKLTERKGNVLKVQGLDAFNLTQVIDIKPYIPDDALLEARTPEWVKKSI